MNLHISPNDSVPLYQQIVNQIKYMVSSGQLQPGDILPPIRTLSETIVVNANTVARAYRDLEREGFVTLQRGIGTRVNEKGSPLSAEERARILNDRARTLLGEARQMNLSLDDVLQLINTCAEEMSFTKEDTTK